MLAVVTTFEAVSMAVVYDTVEIAFVVVVEVLLAVVTAVVAVVVEITISAAGSQAVSLICSTHFFGVTGLTTGEVAYTAKSPQNIAEVTPPKIVAATLAFLINSILSSKSIRKFRSFNEL